MADLLMQPGERPANPLTTAQRDDASAALAEHDDAPADQADARSHIEDRDEAETLVDLAPLDEIAMLLEHVSGILNCVTSNHQSTTDRQCLDLCELRALYAADHLACDAAAKAASLHRLLLNSRAH